MKNLFILLTGCILLSSCLTTVGVHREDKKVKMKKVKGIPFYTQKGIIEQETQYLYKWKEITFIRVDAGAKEKNTILEKNRFPFNSSLAVLREKVLSLNDSNDSKLIQNEQYKSTFSIFNNT